jgi:hypothetical protein
LTHFPDAKRAPPDQVRGRLSLEKRDWSAMTFLRIVITLYLFDLSMIFSENRCPLFRIML